MSNMLVVVVVGLTFVLWRELRLQFSGGWIHGSGCCRRVLFQRLELFSYLRAAEGRLDFRCSRFEFRFLTGFLLLLL